MCKVWDISDPTNPVILNSHQGHTGPNVWSLALFEPNPDQLLLITGGEDGSVRLWDFYRDGFAFHIHAILIKCIEPVRLEIQAPSLASDKQVCFLFLPVM